MSQHECLRSSRGWNLLFVLLITALMVATTACSDPEQTKLEHVQRGEALLKDKKFQEASIEFRNAVQLDDRSAPAHWGLAQAYEGLELFPQAVQEMRRTIEVDPNNLDARARLGNYYLLAYQGQKKEELLTEADKLAEEILARDPKYIEGHILKAGLLYTRGKKDEALARLNEAIQIDPNRVESHLGLARFYQNSGEPAKAEETFKRALSINNASALAHTEYGKFLAQQNRLGEAEAELRKAVEVAPQDQAARVTLASFYYVNKQFDKAEEAYKALADLDRNRPEGRAVLADYYALVNRPDEAMKIYQEIAAAAPDYARARYRLAELMMQRGDVSGAAAQAKEVLDRNPGDIQALLAHARTLMQQERPKEAIEDLKKVLGQEPQHQMGLYFMAEAQLRAGQLDQARVFASDLDRNYPNNLPAKLLQAQINLLAGGKDNFENAKRIATDILTRLDKAAPDASAASPMINELRAKALSARATANAQLENFAAARADFTAARDLDPNNPAPYLYLAGLATAENKLDEAQQLYERALNLEGANLNALTGLTNLYVARRQFDQAHARIDQAIAARPNTPELHHLKATVHGAQQDGAGAEAQLRRALQIDPNYLPAIRTLGTLYINTRRHDDAIAEYKKVLQTRPEDAPSFLMIGMVEDSRQNYDASVEAYKQAVRINPNFDFAANNLAWNYAEHGKGNLDEAIRLAQGVVQRNPEEPGYADTLGWVYYKKGLYPAAIEQLQKAVDKVRARGGDSALYRLHLGLAQAAAGRKADARRQLEQALSIGTGLTPQQTEEARKALATL